jgi:hypothetical protein
VTAASYPPLATPFGRFSRVNSAGFAAAVRRSVTTAPHPAQSRPLSPVFLAPYEPQAASDMAALRSLSRRSSPDSAAVERARRLDSSRAPRDAERPRVSRAGVVGTQPRTPAVADPNALPPRIAGRTPCIDRCCSPSRLRRCLRPRALPIFTPPAERPPLRGTWITKAPRRPIRTRRPGSLKRRRVDHTLGAAEAARSPRFHSLYPLCSPCHAPSVCSLNPIRYTAR